jgi:Ca2+-binding RTX toxin-like protein
VANLTSQNLLFNSGGTGLVIPPRLDETIHIGSDSVIAQGTVFEINDTAPFIIRDVRQAETAAFAIDGALNLPGVTLWNAGTMRYQSTLFDVQVNGITISIEEAYNGRDHSFVNQSTGVVDITAVDADVFGIRGILNVWNAGSIVVRSTQGAAIGITDAGGGSTTSVLVNSGSVTVSAGQRAVGIGYEPTTTAGAALTVNSGSVNVTGAGGSVGIELHLAAHPAAVQPDMVNSGTITVTDTTSAIDSAGLLVQLSANSRIWNSGTITGDYSVRAVSGNTNVDPSAYSLTVYNSGVLDGDVQMSLYHDVLINTNRIDGDVFLGNGDDLYDGRLGQLTGSIDGYDGNDRILAGAGNQRIFGGFGDDLLSGGSGADELTGGFGRDTFRYETGFGQDVILDFDTSGVHDYIDVAGYSAYQSIAQQGADVLITFAPGDTLLLRNVLLSAITPAMIRFGAAAIAANTIPDAPVATAAPAAPTGQAIGAINPNITFLPVVGTADADILSGGAGPDDLRGLAGADTLDGGTGNDLLSGGLGNDRYITDSTQDIVFENIGEGTDTVESSANYYLFANIENLTLTGSTNTFGVGNELDNVLTGNAGENLLIAGAGNDTVNGGGARDAIFGEDGADILNGEAGVDYIVGGVGNDSIDGGADADELYGQDGDDIMRGGASFDTDIMVGGLGNDTIYGNSGLGDYDLLYGNQGNDVFYVDTPADLVFEQAGEGIDTVYADINGAGYYLYDNIENLVLLDDTPFGVGNALDNRLTGNAVGNYLLGGAGNDLLNGMAGNDVLFGEAGNDIFIFDQGTGGDVIGDFTTGQDRIDLSAYGLTFAQLQTLFAQNGNVGAIQFANGDVIVLHNVTMSQLTASDFILTPVAEGSPKTEADVMDVVGAFDEGAASGLFLDLPYADSGLERWGSLKTDIYL